MRLLNTRPEEDARSLTLALQDMGHEVTASPLLQIDFLEATVPDLSDRAGLLATSANGVRAFARLTPDRTLTVFAVGDATARIATEQGFTDVKTASGDVAALADLVRQHCQPSDGTLLHVAGTKVAGDLAGDLEGSGFEVERLVLYQARTAETLPDHAKKKLQAGDLDGVLLYSPRTAETFVSLVRAAGLEKTCSNADVWCLSQAVADKVQVLPWRNIHVSLRPEQASLLQMLAE